MKIVITAVKDSQDSDIDPRFGRAPYFAVYETVNDRFFFVNNAQNLNAASGAGIQAAQNVAATGAKVVITGNCGPKAFKALTSAGIKIVIGVSGKITEAIAKFKRNELSYANEANVEGHW